MKIRHKLPLSFVIVLTLVVGAALFGIVSLRASLNTFSGEVQKGFDQERQVRIVEASFKTQVLAWKETLLRGNDPKAVNWNAFLAEEEKVAKGTLTLEAELPPGPARDLLAQFRQAHLAMGEGYRKGYKTFSETGFVPAAGDMSVRGIEREPTQMLQAAAQRIAADSQEVAEAAAAKGRSAILLSLALMGVVTVIGTVVGIVFSRAIVRPLDAAVGLSEAVAGGDLTREIDVQGQDETASLLLALQSMQGRLTHIVKAVRNTAEGVATASSEIASGNLDLSNRTEQQAAALEETASTMDELGTTARNNAENADKASKLARTTSEVAELGGKVVGDVVTTMREINQHSARVGDIIGVIDGIAFQTNILALNAAVEAARAGEQGRGFAVVASEVRALAQRSATAAQEIKALVQQSVSVTSHGTTQVAKAGETIEKIVGSISQLVIIVQEMANASGKQSQGVGKAGEAITQIDRTTQQNAALVEQSAAAAASLETQAQQLVREVAVFKLAANGEPGTSVHAGVGKTSAVVGEQRRPFGEHISVLMANIKKFFLKNKI
jgi:methyl-accepting chemotaxis protein